MSRSNISKSWPQIYTDWWIFRSLTEVLFHAPEIKGYLEKSLENWTLQRQIRRHIQERKIGESKIDDRPYDISEN